MKKIGILTFHWADDYGAMLQTYGLKYYLQTEGYNVEIIPYSNSNLYGRYNLLPKEVAAIKTRFFVGDYNLYGLARHLKHFPEFWRRKRNMAKFRKGYLTSAKYVSNILSLNTEKYDAVIIGSDQVWNPELTIGLDAAYLGEFPIKTNGKLIAYAASFGKDTLEKEDEKQLCAALDTYFSAISVREQSAIPYLKQFVNKDICATPDPTLLPERKVWEELASECEYGTNKSGYVVFHNTEYNKNMYSYAEQLAERKNKELYIIRQLPVGPLGFLKIIKNADYIVTNSFHGTVFSIVFEKKFVVFAHSNKNSRLRDLLESLGLSYKLSANHNLEDIDREVNWLEVREKAEESRLFGKSFLRESIGE